MHRFYENMEGYEENDEAYPEMPEEFVEVAEDVPEEIHLEEMGIEKEWWNESIDDIPYPDIRGKRMEQALEIVEEEKQLVEDLESGKISKSRFDHENLVVLGKRKANFSTTCDLESMGMTYDHLGDFTEDFDFFIREAGGDPGPAELKERIKEFIRLRGPEYAQEWADEELEKGTLTNEIHKTISRQARLDGK